MKRLWWLPLCLVFVGLAAMVLISPGGNLRILFHGYDCSSRGVAELQLKNFAGAIEQYSMVHGTPPETLDVLLQVDPENFDDPYLDEIPTDPWGHPYVYRKLDPTSFELTSLGADGQGGGEGEAEDVVLRWPE